MVSADVRRQSVVAAFLGQSAECIVVRLAVYRIATRISRGVVIIVLRLFEIDYQRQYQSICCDVLLVK